MLNFICRKARLLTYYVFVFFFKNCNLNSVLNVSLCLCYQIISFLLHLLSLLNLCLLIILSMLNFICRKARLLTYYVFVFFFKNCNLNSVLSVSLCLCYQITYLLQNIHSFVYKYCKSYIPSPNSHHACFFKWFDYLQITLPILHLLINTYTLRNG